ncbi:hypothetical protein ANCCAN_03765 [Ancylostoma caninum]|uniref:G-protein coupled receptors family 1 profile domain-containing protein n=1 Tax=Ancylostoma caninum TaxID=29170 RepID=A0A368H4F6_ANCCA|nr:hypothetical protein ANCCAN_03765 [Ancylostoma caninum]
MSLLVLTNSTSGRNSNDRLFDIPHCKKKRCDDMKTEMYNTVLLHLAEILVILGTILLNVLLIAAVSTPRCRFPTAFFKLTRILSLVLLLHSVVSMTLKTLPSLFDVEFHYQNEVSLWIDLFSRYSAVLLIFILALNRFCVLVVGRLDEFLFSGLRYVVLPCIALAVAAAMTALVVKLCEMERTYVDWLGFVDYVESPEFYLVSTLRCLLRPKIINTSQTSGHCLLVFPVLSVLLHIFVLLWIRKRRFHPTKSTAVDKAERRMCIQVVFFALFELAFILFFALLSAVPINNKGLYVIISLYNILSAIPELLIPAFVVFGTRGMLNSLGIFCVKNNATTRRTTPTHTGTD